MKQILNNISKFTLSIMGEGRGVSILLMALVMMAISPQRMWADANNVITYKASEKLAETTDEITAGLHTNAFGSATISSHAFADGVGTITFSDDVTSIGAYAFTYCSNLTSITIPSSVTSIGDRAFYGCTNLSSITIPSSVTSIGCRAFSSCSNLSSITIPSSVTSIGAEAFSFCQKLSSITIPSGVTSIGDKMFYNCQKLSSITIPSSVTSIGDWAFYDCLNLSSITIPSSVKSIGDNAFSWCSNLSSITIQSGVTSIGNSAFYKCSNLSSITIPSSVKSIGNSAFANCDSLSSITIPSRVKRIGDYMFFKCVKLSSITIPSSVTSIGVEAFEDCSVLSSITIPSSVTSIGKSAFANCYKLTTVCCEGTSPASAGTGIFNYCYFLTKILVPAGSADTYKTAENWSNYADKIQEIVANVTTSAGATTFYGTLAAALTAATDGSTITLQQDVNETISDIDYTKYTTGLTVKLNGHTLTGVDFTTAPCCRFVNGVYTVSAIHHYGNSATCTVCGAEIPKITYTASAKLSETTTPNASGLHTDAFGSATVIGHTFADGIGTIYFGSEVTSIGSSAFSGCNSLTSVACYATTPATPGSDIFKDCNALTKIYVPASSVEAYKSSWTDYADKIEAMPITLTTGSATSEYAILADALTAATDGSTITLYKDFSEQVTIDYTKYTTNGLTVNLNGHTLTGVDMTKAPCYRKNGDVYTLYSGHKYVNGVCTVCGSKLTTIGVTITKDDAASPTVVKSVATLVTINKSSTGEAQVTVQNGTEVVTTATLEHLSRYIFDITTLKTINPGDDNLDGNIIPHAPRRTVALQQPALAGPALVIGTATAYTIYPLDAHHSNITLGIAKNGNYVVNGTEIAGTVTSIYFKDPHRYAVADRKCTLCEDEAPNNMIIYAASEKLAETTAMSSPGLHTNAFGSATISSHAFADGVGTITFSDDVTSIGQSAFYACSNLTSINIPDNVVSIGAYAFDNTAWYDNQPDGLVYAGKVVYKYKGTMPENTAITLNADTKGIAEYAFKNCYNLTSIILPSSVTSIGGYAFQECTDLTYIVCESSTPASLGNLAFNYYEGNQILSNLKAIYVPEGSVATYKAAEKWKDYADLIMTPVATATTSAGVTTFYSNLADAIAAAPDGSTIKLKRNVTITSETSDIAIEIGSDNFAATGITIDLDQKKLTIDNNSSANIAISCEGGNKIMIKNGTFVINNYMYGFDITNSLLTLDKVNVDGNFNLHNTTLKASSTTTITGCTLYVNNNSVGALSIANGIFTAPTDYKWTAGEDGFSTLSQHKPFKYAPKDAICYKEGIYEYYWGCTDCDKAFTDETCTTEKAKPTIPATGNHTYVEDEENHRVTCSTEGCPFQTPILMEGANSGLTYAANYKTTNFESSSSYTTWYYFKAPGTGTLYVTDNGSSSSDKTVGALFNADKSSLLAVAVGGNGVCFSYHYKVTEGQVYWIGARAYMGNTELTDRTINISGTWPHPVESLTFTDGEAYDGSLQYKQAANFTYKRTFYNNEYNCLYVPFKAKASDFTDCTIYAINMFQEHDTDGDGVLDALTLEVYKAPEGAILITNRPYLIKYTGALTDAEKTNGKEVEIAMNDIYFDEAFNSKFSLISMSTQYFLNCTYSAIDAATATNSNYYTIIRDSNGKHVIGKTTSGVKPQRWYMIMEALDPQLEAVVSNAAKSITIVDMDEEDETTGIVSYENDNENENNRKYLENGKVVIVRNGKKYNVNGQIIK